MVQFHFLSTGNNRMSNAMYQASARIFTHNLKNLSAILKLAAKDAKARGIDPEVLLVSRLVPDMLPLTSQVQMATDNAKAACARLAGVDAPVFKDDEATFAQLQSRIKNTLAFVGLLKPAQFEGCEARDVVMTLPVGSLCFSGVDYLNGFALPNFYFHVGMVYSILRSNGVTLGKMDFLGKVPGMSGTGQIAKIMKLPAAKKKAKPKGKSKTESASRKTASKTARKKR
jgi:hypothetical protein